MGGLPDWGTIYRMISRGKKWRHLIDEAYSGEKDYGEPAHSHKKKHWWNF